jgi:hypothetical protein
LGTASIANTDKAFGEIAALDSRHLAARLAQAHRCRGQGIGISFFSFPHPQKQRQVTKTSHAHIAKPEESIAQERAQDRTEKTNKCFFHFSITSKKFKETRMAKLANADKAFGEIAALDSRHLAARFAQAAKFAQGKSGRKLFPSHFIAMLSILTMAKTAKIIMKMSNESRKPTSAAPQSKAADEDKSVSAASADHANMGEVLE